MDSKVLTETINELENAANALRKVLNKEITQKQAAIELGVTQQAFSNASTKNNLSIFVKRKVIAEDKLFGWLRDIETPCEKIAKDILGIEDKKGKNELVVVDTESQDLFLQQMEVFLTDKEMEIMRLYYGIDTGTQLTFHETGKQAGLNAERVRQIIKKSLRKLRSPEICQYLLPNFRKYTKTLQDCREIRETADDLDDRYRRATEEYNWLLHKKELVETLPEFRKKLEDMMYLADADIPKAWKDVLYSRGIRTISDYIDADRTELEEIRKTCPDFSCTALDKMLGLTLTKKQMDEIVSKTPIIELNLSVRTCNALYRNKIRTLGELVAVSQEEKGLLRCTHIGGRSYMEIREALKSYGIQIPEI